VASCRGIGRKPKSVVPREKLARESLRLCFILGELDRSARRRRRNIMANPSTPFRNKEETRLPGTNPSTERTWETGSSVTEKAKDIASSAAQTAGQTAAGATQKARDMASSAAHTASDLASAVGQRAEEATS